MALVDGHAPFAGGPPPQVEVDEKRRRLSIVGDEVAHERIDDVLVEDDRHVAMVPITIAAPKAILGAADGLRLARRRRARYIASMIKHIDFVSVPVADQKRALKFY